MSSDAILRPGHRRRGPLSLGVSAPWLSYLFLSRQPRQRLCRLSHAAIHPPVSSIGTLLPAPPMFCPLPFFFVPLWPSAFTCPPLLAEPRPQIICHDSKTPGSSQEFRRESDARSGCGIGSSTPMYGSVLVLGGLYRHPQRKNGPAFRFPPARAEVCVLSG
jgi:hypothetical protein